MGALEFTADNLYAVFLLSGTSNNQTIGVAPISDLPSAQFLEYASQGQQFTFTSLVVSTITGATDAAPRRAL